MVSNALYDYAETHQILSSTQKGFRKRASCMDQVQMVTMALEDARLTGQDIYMMQIDFSNAFGMIDHDKLLQIMWDLGFPPDAIEVVKNLYTGATTRVRWGLDKTGPIPVDRGTIQGDSLSPLLFLIYLEPLLRWLHWGGRGYKFGCITDTDTKIKQQLSAAAFADDLSITTNCISDLHIQARKLSDYSDWVEMKISASKSIVSAMPYRQIHVDGGSTAKTQIRQIANQLRNKIQVQDQYISYQSPEDPFTYLGVTLTMTLDWRPQMRAMSDTLKHKMGRLASSCATERQIRRIIKTCVVPAVAYSMGVTPCTPADIKLLDGAITRAYKRTLGIPNGTPTAMVHEDVERWGLGIPSLAVEQASRGASLLIESLQDEGRLGVVSRALLLKQAKHIGGGNNAQAVQHRDTRYCLRVRQLALMQKVDLLIKLRGVPQFTDKADLMRVIQNLNPWGTTTHPEIPWEFLRPLLDLGITNLEEVLEPDGKHVLTGAALKLRWGRLARRKHIVALNALASLLNQAPGVDADMRTLLRESNADKARDRSARCIHATNLHVTLATTPEGELGQAPCPAKPNDQKLITAYLQQATHTNTPTAAPDRNDTQQTDPPTRPTANNRADRPTGKEPTFHRQEKQHKRKRKPETHVRAAIPHMDKNAVNAPLRIDHSYKQQEVDRRFKEAAKIATEAESAIAVMAETYETSVVAQIIGYRTATDHPNRRKRKHANAADKTIQKQYLVSWEQTLVEEWALPYFEQAGYKPILEEGTTPASRADMSEDAARCEVCRQAESRAHPGKDNHDDMPICDTCEKTYHVECIHQCKEYTEPAEGVQWECPACAIQLLEEDAPEPAKIVRVRWRPTWEPEEILRENPETAEALNAWDKTHANQPPARMQGHTVDSHLTCPLQRQGTHTTERPAYSSTLGSQLRKTVNIQFADTHPGLDIAASRECKVEVRQVTLWTPPPPNTDPDPNHPPTITHEAACIYGRDGRCVGIVTKERLTTMRHMYDQKHDAHTLPPTRGTFAEEMTDLLQRQQPTGTRKRNTAATQAGSPISAHPSIMRVVRDHLGCSHERQATPLTISGTSGTFDSKHEGDQAFGAAGEPYSHRWAGASVALLPHDDTLQRQGVRWAAMSAHDTSTPTMTVLLLPRKSAQEGKPEYMQWASEIPGIVTHIATIQGGAPLVTGDVLWTRRKKPTWTRHSCMHVLIVWNSHAQQGWTRARGKALMAALGTACSEANGHLRVVQNRAWLARLKEETHTPVTTNPTTGTDHRAVRPSKKFKEAGTPAMHTHTHAMRHAPCDTATYTPSPAIHAWNELTYCDGSLQRVPQPRGDTTLCMGAALYDAKSKTIKTVAPGEAETGGTANHAELAAICAAIEAVDEGKAANIASDCLCALQQLGFAVLHPYRLTYHPQKNLLERITGHLRVRAERGDPCISFFKVNAHNGIIGNEMADLGAKRAAKATTHDICLNLQSGDNSEKERTYWPYSKIPNRREQNADTDTTAPQAPNQHAGAPAGTNTNTPPAAAEDTQAGTDTHTRALKDTRTAVRQHMHPLHKLGTSNTESMYFKFWQRMPTHADGVLSNPYLTNALCKHGQRKTVVAYRCGVLHSAKRAKMYGLCATDACPLCGQGDGGSHIASGCQHNTMTRMYTERHNKAGRMVLSCISKGSMGGALVSADVGRKEKCQEDGVPIMATNHVPEWLLPPPPGTTQTQKEEHIQALRLLKPDILLVTGDRTPQAAASSQIYIVEIKTCIDTRHEAQLAAARDQHTNLIQRLVGQGYAMNHIHTIPILVGVSGTIYTQHTLQALEQLGVPADKARTKCQKLHLEMTKRLHDIVVQRRILEPKTSDKKPPRPP